jgi:hypothetical protein
LLTLQRLDLAALALDRALLVLDLTLLLLRGHFLVLQRIADHVASACAKRATYRRSCSWMTYCGAD